MDIIIELTIAFQKLLWSPNYDNYNKFINKLKRTTHINLNICISEL